MHILPHVHYKYMLSGTVKGFLNCKSLIDAYKLLVGFSVTSACQNVSTDPRTQTKFVERAALSGNRRVCVVGGILVSTEVFTHIWQLIINAEALRGYSDMAMWRSGFPRAVNTASGSKTPSEALQTLVEKAYYS